MDASRQAAPLARYSLVDTRDPEEARARIGEIFCPHFLAPSARRPVAFHARHHCAQQLGYSVNFVAYGAEVEIDPGELEHFYLLQWPVRGAADVRCGAGRVDAGAGVSASLLSPTLPTRMLWRAGCEKMIALIRRDAMQRQFQVLTGCAAPDVEFDVGVAMNSGLGRQLARHLELMTEAAEGAAPAPYQALLGDALTSLLLMAAPHNQTALLAAPSRAAASGAVRRAEAYIEANIGGPLAIADVARAAGANLRSLQSAFRNAHGMTLTQWAQGRRLEHFRRRLCDPSAPASITELAYAAGLGHLGRAAAAYKARYGETPRETLRRR